MDTKRKPLLIELIAKGIELYGYNFRACRGRLFRDMHTVETTRTGKTVSMLWIDRDTEYGATTGIVVIES
jgi:hypothetical protein